MVVDVVGDEVVAGVEVGSWVDNDVEVVAVAVTTKHVFVYFCIGFNRLGVVVLKLQWGQDS